MTNKKEMTDTEIITAYKKDKYKLWVKATKIKDPVMRNKTIDALCWCERQVALDNLKYPNIK